MNLHVSIQISHTTKAFVTLSTFKGFHNVYDHVTLQIAHKYKAFVTLSTSEGLLATVDSHVSI